MSQSLYCGYFDDGIILINRRGMCYLSLFLFLKVELSPLKKREKKKELVMSKTRTMY